MYWQPNRHYEPMKNLDHSIFIEKKKEKTCAQTCHEEATPGILSDWRSSGHKKSQEHPISVCQNGEIEGNRTNRVFERSSLFDFVMLIQKTNGSE